ncbi:MAG TPA: Do family serine endopeptidase [Terriglobales bacterium]|nr:Do family serine endopeptidase [Terriglobales bacterium]
MRRSSPYLLIVSVGVVLAVLLGAGGPGTGRLWPELVAGQDQPFSLDPQTHPLMDQISGAFEAAAAKVSAFVVPIFAEQVVQASSQGLPDDPLRDFFGDDFFRRFFGAPFQGQKRTVHSLGSGVVVSPGGHILTNNHVVAGASKLTVILGDKKKFEAKVIGTDPLTDVAVIKVEARDLPAAVLGDSDKVKVGQWVIAVGNPFELMRTVTHGIISAEGRSSVGLATYEDFIQTDAPINPGNSGGALADLDGSVIGINTAITSPTGGNVGLGFAIPINMARSVMKELLAKGRVIRGYLGLTAQDIDDSLVKPLKLKDASGALVSEVVPGSPADRAGIKTGDAIVEFNGKKVESSSDIHNDAASTAPGTKVGIVLLRNGETIKTSAVLLERPAEKGQKSPRSEEPKGPTSQKLGLSVQTLTPDIAQQLGYGNDKGVIVADVASGSPADDAGLQRGDLIKEVNRIPVRSTQDFEKAIRGLRSGDTAALLVRRGDQTFFRPLKIQ